jgi:hypothetical protein
MTIIYLLIGVEILVVLLVSGFLLKKLYNLLCERKKRKNNNL